MTLTDTIKQEARSLGFDVVGICRVPPSAEDPGSALPGLLSTRLLEWLRRGYQGVMEWMARNPARRADPRVVLSGCRSVISVGMNYSTDQRADERPGHGRIARYAWGEDYHRVLGQRLEKLEARIKALAPGAGTKWYVDTGPVMEKAWAQQAGLGWIGKHSNLVSERFGSWLLLGEILTTLELDPDEPGVDLCGTCTLCIRACPTGAITEAYLVDASKCISYLTIECRGDEAGIPENLRRLTGNRIFGCDDCLEVCPFNVQATPTKEPAFQPTPLTVAPPLAALARMTPDGFAETFGRSPIRRPRHEGFMRNVRIALGNQRQKVKV